MPDCPALGMTHYAVHVHYDKHLANPAKIQIKLLNASFTLECPPQISILILPTFK
jgi:hypothetical protein